MTYAFQIGISPVDFWQLTPWQFGVCLKAFNKKSESEYLQQVFLMWHGAALTRVKKMPPLDAFKPKKQVRGIDEDAIKKGFAALKARYERHNGNKS